MWCRHCQQDVPAIASSGEKKFRCPRCHEPLSVHRAADKNVEASSTESPGTTVRGDERTEDTQPFENWELDDQLQHIGRVLNADKAWAKRLAKARRREAARIDFAHDEHSGSQSCYASPTLSALLGHKATTPARKNRSKFDTFLIWTAMLVGIVSLIGGGVLLGWSVYANRGDFWRMSLPIIAGGQIVLLLALVLQLGRIWQDNRHVVNKLDHEINDLKTTTNMLGTINGPSSSAFYTHLAGGANPQLLLNDLKGQLDLLAVKLSERQ